MGYVRDEKVRFLSVRDGRAWYYVRKWKGKILRIASVRNSADLPRCLFCTCSQPHLVRMYGALGFRPSLEGTDRGCCIVRWETARTVLTASSGNITVRRGPARQRDVSQWSCPRVEPSLLYWTGDSP